MKKKKKKTNSENIEALYERLKINKVGYTEFLYHDHYDEDVWRVEDVENIKKMPFFKLRML